MYLILGLGNPGPRYELSRHNMGFLAVDALAQKHGIQLGQHRYFSLYGQGEVNGIPVVVAKPMTYMNESGRAVQALLQGLQFSPDRILVVHDDIDLPLGKIKRKSKGGDAGQRGLASIIGTLGTDQFARLRIGIGRPETQDQIVDYVLSPFLDEEISTVNEILEKAVLGIEELLAGLNKKSNQTEEQTE